MPLSWCSPKDFDANLHKNGYSGLNSMTSIGLVKFLKYLYYKYYRSINQILTVTRDKIFSRNEIQIEVASYQKLFDRKNPHIKLGDKDIKNINFISEFLTIGENKKI